MIRKDKTACAMTRGARNLGQNPKADGHLAEG